MKRTLSLIAAFAILNAASGCAIFSKTAPTTEHFKASFYRHFPTPPHTLDERADMVEFWCVNRPADVPDHPICDLEDGDV